MPTVKPETLHLIVEMLIECHLANESREESQPDSGAWMRSLTKIANSAAEIGRELSEGNPTISRVIHQRLREEHEAWRNGPYFNDEVSLMDFREKLNHEFERTI